MADMTEKSSTACDDAPSDETGQDLAINNNLINRLFTRIALKTWGKLYKSNGFCRPISRKLIVKTGPRVDLTEAHTRNRLSSDQSDRWVPSMSSGTWTILPAFMIGSHHSLTPSSNHESLRSRLAVGLSLQAHPHYTTKQLLVPLTDLPLNSVGERVTCDGDISSMSQTIAATVMGLAISSYSVGNGPKYWN
jgi:hypothetical protein